MTVAKTLHDFLEARDLPESVLRHSHTSSSSETAEAAHVPGRQLAKGVVIAFQYLSDDQFVTGVQIARS